MDAKELRHKFISFFEAKEHKVIPSASLIPENDPSVLFTTAGMHPLVPYLGGETHPEGKRLVDVQKCIRVDDIDEVGDTSHNTFFEMLGNWSLGDYFKTEAVSWSYDFLTNKKWLGLDPGRLSVTCFAGDSDAPRDEESAKLWEKAGIPQERIHFLPKSENWWGLAGGGPCGPDTEIFYDTDPEGPGCCEHCHPGCDCGKYVEIWNNVFMQYDKQATGTEVMWLRHGETDWNIEKKIQGDLETQLNETGRQQAAKAKQEVRDFSPDIVLTSPLERAQQTAEIVAPESAKIIAEPLAVERDMGELEGMTQQELMDSCPSDMFIKRGEIYYCVTPPGGESLNEAKSRTEKLLKKVLQEYRGKKVLIVSHGDIIDMALACERGVDPEETIGTHAENLATTSFELYDYLPLKQKNVDTGMGLERTLAVINNLDDVYRTELFWPLLQALERLSHKKYGVDKRDDFAFRVIADHIRAATFILADSAQVVPSNVEQGYILRRLIRRAVRFAKKLGVEPEFSLGKDLANVVISQYSDTYPELSEHKERVITEISKEENKFEKTLTRGLRQFQKMKGKGVSGKEAFDLFQTYGFPIEMTAELAEEMGATIDRQEFDRHFAKHQELSRQGATKKFKGGLGDTTGKTVSLHTATHLLLASLRQVLGNHVYQKGSNITPDRLRFDFSHSQKLTDDEKKAVEDLVNEKIQADLSIKTETMTVDEAKKQGAIGVFGEKYGDKVKVYSVGGFSKEICGGPHVERTGEMGHFRIKKEQSSGAGVRRIKAVLE